ncbi:MAG: GNAT family N-acetyltransferase [Hyphomonadaceae bacterium]
MRNNSVSVDVVRGLDQWFAAHAVRAVVYVGEQDYGFAEEFDGGDLTGASHIIAREQGEPVGACRIRWFAEFAKLERVAVKRAHRSGHISRALWRAASELAARKGYRYMLGHLERSLLPFWARLGDFKPRDGRETYSINGREFVEAIAELAPHPRAISLASPPTALLDGDALMGWPMARAS